MALKDHDYILPEFWPVGDRPQTYILISSTHQNKKIMQDNFGFLYFKSKVTQTKIYLKCNETKTNGCPATAYVPTLQNDDSFHLSRLHNHPVRPSTTEVRKLRSELRGRYVKNTARPYSARTLYAEAVVKYPEGADNYKNIQAMNRMRQIRKSVYSPTPSTLSHLHDLLQLENNRHFTTTF